ncbi:hypothetical protein DPMN_183309 [Dreissena polymorpha]|uniref:Uncharacterized protein n=1 Tax=Dreissena polymorpha TaxID=45954 RepID=A0A9D4DIT3_DREPO|nr:hypothetical protein DPMN_183309 [Dreissena polymorpha]
MIGQTHVTSRKTNVLTKFHENWAENVTSRELAYKNAPPTSGYETNVLTKFHEERTKYVTSRNTATPPGRHVFSPIWTIFELVRDINKTNVLTKFHDDWANILTSKLHEDWAWHVTSKGFTRFFFFDIHGPVSNSIDTKNLLTKSHEDRTRNVASILFTNKCGRTTDGRTTDGRTMDKYRSQKLT